jgi:predicted HTH transcriptional regulator
MMGFARNYHFAAIKQAHSSQPRNPIIAGACFLGGYIDSWGSGIMKILNSCKAAGLPTPELNLYGINSQPLAAK